jgi:hypothetical protein
MKTATKTAVKKVTPVVDNSYHVTFRTLGKNYTATGETVSDAIKALKPGIARGVSLITVSRNGKSSERIMGGIQTQKLFNTAGLTQQIVLKQISSLFDGI